MFERFERPVKIICLALAGLLAWQLGNLILRGDPLANLIIPALPALPGATNEPAKPAPKETNAVVKKTGTSGPNATNGANLAGGTNVVKGTNAVSGTNAMTKSTNATVPGGTGQTNASSGPRRGRPRGAGPGGEMPGMPPGMTPDMMDGMPPEIMAQMMGGGMPGGRGERGMKKVELPPEVQARVERVINSEIFGPVMRPMPMMLLGIAEDEAFLQATNGQSGPVKVGGEMGGIKLLRIGINRVLVEQGGEKQELTLFNGVGGESLMPKPSKTPSKATASTNTPSTNGPAKRASARNTAAGNASTNQTLSSKQKETQ